MDQSTVVLSWNQPHYLGGRTDTVYRVVCDACNVGVTYNPSQVTYRLLSAVAPAQIAAIPELGSATGAGRWGQIFPSLVLQSVVFVNGRDSCALSLAVSPEC